MATRERPRCPLYLLRHCVAQKDAAAIAVAVRGKLGFGVRILFVQNQIHFRIFNFKTKDFQYEKFLEGSLYLVAFAAAGILFQISCSNSNDAPQQQLLNPAATGKVIYTMNFGTSIKIYTRHYDGSNQTEIPVVLPAGIKIFDGVAARHAKDLT